MQSQLWDRQSGVGIELLTFKLETEEPPLAIAAKKYLKKVFVHLFFTRKAPIFSKESLWAHIFSKKSLRPHFLIEN